MFRNDFRSVFADDAFFWSARQFFPPLRFLDFRFGERGRCVLPSEVDKRTLTPGRRARSKRAAVIEPESFRFL